MREEWRDCYAEWDQRELVIGNSVIERRWLYAAGSLPLRPSGLVSKEGDVRWLTVPVGISAASAQESVFSVTREPLVPGATEGLLVRLSFPAAETRAAEDWLFRIAPGAALVLQQVIRESRLAASVQPVSVAAAESTGIENDAAALAPATGQTFDDLCEDWSLPLDNLILHHLQLQDQTDGHDNLLRHQRYRLGPIENLSLGGCVFALENPLTRRGVILLKHAPLPYARAAFNPCDLLTDRSSLRLIGQGTGESGGEGYPWAVILFSGGEAGLIRALQRERQLLHPYRLGRDGLALSNTWGDRSQDGAISEGFLLRELQAARELSVDVCQIDDGWQRGATANSVAAKEKGGVWEGFYAFDPDFWQVNLQRLPNGLTPVLCKAKEVGLHIGLWFAPDSAHDFANWRKDADTVLRFYREQGIHWIKIDGVKSRSKVGERNLRLFFAAVIEGSAGEVLFDLDVTAEVRPGYFGRPEVGSLFVENRYTDWHRYWPHATLRNLWQLAHALPPSCLRIEWLNPERNRELYKNDPLAPAECPVEYVFAGIMVASPLIWCELSSLSAAVKEHLAAAIHRWKPWREELHTATVYPVGEEPDGGSWTGFLAVQEEKKVAHLIALRQCTPQTEYTFRRPATCPEFREDAIQNLGGAGNLHIDSDGLRVQLQKQKSFGWWRFPL